MHPTVRSYLKSLEAEGRASTARGYGNALKHFAAWLAREDLDAVAVTAEDLRRFQRWLAHGYISPRTREPLTKGTQGARLSAVKSYYDWLERNRHVLVDPARNLVVPTEHHRTVQRDYLTLQEAIAFLDTAAALADAWPVGCIRSAQRIRDLAFLATALASGRRLAELQDLRVPHFDPARRELRVERVKGGKAGRVLPIAGWAVEVLNLYLARARPVLDCWGPAGGEYLFVGDRGPQMARTSIQTLLEEVQRETAERNPDLEELPRKTITAHSLRVSFAKLLFDGGCNIRALNELLMHESLSTTAKYTPLDEEDLRRAARKAHPRS